MAVAARSLCLVSAFGCFEDFFFFLSFFFGCDESFEAMVAFAISDNLSASSLFMFVIDERVEAASDADSSDFFTLESSAAVDSWVSSSCTKSLSR